MAVENVRPFILMGFKTHPNAVLHLGRRVTHLHTTTRHLHTRTPYLAQLHSTTALFNQCAISQTGLNVSPDCVCFGSSLRSHQEATGLKLCQTAARLFVSPQWLVDSVSDEISAFWGLIDCLFKSDWFATSSRLDQLVRPGGVVGHCKQQQRTQMPQGEGVCVCCTVCSPLTFVLGLPPRRESQVLEEFRPPVQLSFVLVLILHTPLFQPSASKGPPRREGVKLIQLRVLVP